MRRRQPPRSADGPPAELLTFELARWLDPDDRGRPDGGVIRAYYRYLAAVRAWRGAHGVSFERWQAWKR